MGFHLNELNNFLIHLIRLLGVFFVIKSAVSLIVSGYNKYHLIKIIVLIILIVILPNVVDSITSLKNNFGSTSYSSSVSTWDSRVRRENAPNSNNISAWQRRVRGQ